MSMGHGKWYRIYSHLESMGFPINTIIEAFKPENVCRNENEVLKKLRESVPSKIIVWDDAPYWLVYTPLETWALSEWSCFVNDLYGDDKNNVFKNTYAG